MNNKNVKGIIALALVTVLSFGVILGCKSLTQDDNANQKTDAAQETVVDELDTAGVENIEKAVKTENGYTVTVKNKGYGGDILMNVSFDETVSTITSVEIIEQSETPEVGAKVAEAEFLSQFDGVAAPVLLPGMSLQGTTTEATETKELTLIDGTYEAKTAEADSNGYIDVVNMTVEDGKITAVVWDCVDAEGNLKSVLSENGQYVMTEDGPTWKEQAEALGAAIVASQNVDGLGVNEEGKTDAVSGVSIYIGGFASLAEECIKQAAGVQDTVVLNDGTYEAKTAEADSNGFIDVVAMTVEDGKITAVVWDCIDADGNKKSVLSENGQYTMTEDGPTWKEQAEALGAAIVASQNIDGLGMNEEGKTDAVSGVSIYIGGFAGLVEQCLNDAAGVEAETAPAPANGTQVDAVSGATISSTAVVKGINDAFAFVQTVK